MEIRERVRSGLRGLLAWMALVSACAVAGPVPYDIVYVRAPRNGDTVASRWPEVVNPVQMEPGSDLMLLHPDGSEEVLFAGGNGAVMDPAVSFDARSVYFAWFPDVRASALNGQRANAPLGGADLYKLDLASRKVVRLTEQTWTPPEGAASWSSDHLRASSADAVYLGYGIFNLAPCPLPGGRLMFVSSRDGYLPNKGLTFPNLRLYVMDDDGRNVEAVGHLNIGSALHPTVLKDGRVMFSSYETQGARDSRVWALWTVWPDGSRFEPLMSAFKSGAAFHFQTQLADESIAVVEYYNLNNNGFGTLLAFDAKKRAGAPGFGSPVPADASNPEVRRGLWYFEPGHPAHLTPRYTKYAFSPPGLRALTAFTHGEDQASGYAADGSWVGKVTHPSAAPGNDVLVVWSPGPVNNLDRPTHLPRPDGGIYLLRGGVPVTDHRDLVLVRNDPRYNEMQPRALVPYSAIHGVAEPASLPFLRNDGSLHAELPAGTPFGLVGTSSFYNRNTSPGMTGGAFDGLDAFNTAENDANPNWQNQGADAGRYSNDDIYAVRILAMEGVAHRSYGPGGNEPAFKGHAEDERLRILGEIPLRKSDGGVDPNGDPDTSFLARIPADTPFTFQTLDRNGLALNMAQTWHQVRPGEMRVDCGGCHAHNRAPVDFAKTAAGRPGFKAWDLIERTTLLGRDAQGKLVARELAQRSADVEFHRDIKPILERACVQCHSVSGRADAGLALDDTTRVDGIDNTYRRLADDANARFGPRPVIDAQVWRQTNASRYVRKFQARRSLLAWKVFGARLDGWSNADHPTEARAGDAASLPAGANRNEADLDYTGTIMPPPGSGIPPLTEDEKLTIARWIDLGAPATSQDPRLAKAGWFSDELKPTLTVSSPRAGRASAPLTAIRVGAYDSTSGLDPASLSVVANFVVNGKPPGTELGRDFVETADHVWTLAIAPIAQLRDGRITVSVKDRQGNRTTVLRSFDVGRVRLKDPGS